MKYRFLAAMMAAALLVAGCSKHDTPTPEPTPETIEYTIVSTKTYDNYDSFVSQMSSGDNKMYSTVMGFNSVKQLVETKFTVKDSPVDIIRYTYKSVDPQDQEVTLSSYLAVPKGAFDGTPADGIMLYNHPTYMSEAQCGYENDIFESVLAWTNLIFVAPDYYGFGVSADKPQAYLNQDLAGRNSIDAYKAAVQILKDKGAQWGTKLYNTGYSQGGFNSIANEKYVSEHPSDGIKFSKTIAGGGSYDVQGAYDKFLTGSYGEGSIFGVCSIISFNECEKLGIPYSSILKEPLLSNYQEWVLSKKYSSSEISAKMGTQDITELLTDDILAKKGDAFDAIWAVCDKFSLVKGDWTPADGSDIRIYHSSLDDVVPFYNSEALKAVFDKQANGKFTCSLTDINGITLPSDLQLALGLVGSSLSKHTLAAVLFFYQVIAAEL